MLQRLLEAKDALQETAMDHEYKQWVTTNVKNKAIRYEGKAIVEKAVDESFWQSVTQLTSICEPIISLLHLVDGSAPSVGKVFWSMFQIDSGIDNSSLDQPKNHSKPTLTTGGKCCTHCCIQLALYWIQSTVCFCSICSTRMRKLYQTSTV